MNQDSYKAWIDAMPIEDVKRRTERLERKLSDLHMLARLYADRQGESAGETGAEPGPENGHGEEPADGEGSSGGEQAYEQG
jgi:hypothetical protein